MGVQKFIFKEDIFVVNSIELWFVWVSVCTQFVLYTGPRAPSHRGAPPHQVSSWLLLGAHHVQEWRWAVWHRWVSSEQSRYLSVPPMIQKLIYGTQHDQSLPSSSSYLQTGMFLILVTLHDIQVNIDLCGSGLWNILMLVCIPHKTTKYLNFSVHLFIWCCSKFSFREWLTVAKFLMTAHPFPSLFFVMLSSQPFMYPGIMFSHYTIPAYLCSHFAYWLPLLSIPWPVCLIS